MVSRWSIVTSFEGLLVKAAGCGFISDDSGRIVESTDVATASWSHQAIAVSGGVAIRTILLGIALPVWESGLDGSAVSRLRWCIRLYLCYL